MAEKKIEVNSINLTVGKKKLELTVDEAKKLKEALNDLFPGTTAVLERHHYHNWQWTTPIYPQNPWIVTCSTADDSVKLTPTAELNATGLLTVEC